MLTSFNSISKLLLMFLIFLDISLFNLSVLIPTVLNKEQK